MARLLPQDAIGTFDGHGWEADTIMEWDHLVAGVEPLANLAQPGLTIRLGAPETIDGRRVNVVQVLSPDVSLVPLTSEVGLLLDEATGLVCGYRLTARGRNPENGKGFRVVMRARYDVFNTQPRFTDADFVFTPPRGAKKAGAWP